MGRDFKSQHLWKPLRSPWASPGDVSPFSGSPGPRASRAPAPVHDSERPLLGLRVPSAGRTTPLTALGRGPDFLHGHGPSPHTPEAPWLTGLGKVGVGAAWDPPPAQLRKLFKPCGISTCGGPGSSALCQPQVLRKDSFPESQRKRKMPPAVGGVAYIF